MSGEEISRELLGLLRTTATNRHVLARVLNALHTHEVISVEQLCTLAERIVVSPGYYRLTDGKVYLKNVGRQGVKLIRDTATRAIEGRIMDPAENNILINMWRKFDRGDPLTDSELSELIESASDGLRYLQARGERFVSYKTIMDLETLRGFQRARREK